MESDKLQKIGILGGTFDPVHSAHLMVAQEARRAAGLQGIIFMPAGAPPHKPARLLTAPEHRLAMVKLAIDGIEGFEVSDLEIRSPGVDYTVDTLRAISGQLPGARLYFVVGGDSLMYLDQWRSPGELMGLAAVIAVYRPGCALAGLEEKRADLLARFGGEVLLVACPGVDLSSTDIRRRAALGLPVTGLVPAAVERYILENNLYWERK